MALKGIRVVELAGLAPSPLCGMILADFGANVVRVDRIGAPINYDVTGRGKQSIAVNLKDKEGVNIVKKLCARSDVLIEPFRAGIMEKLGLGPDLLLDDNPKLIYARLTGYGQEGPYANMAGHDINYLATSGVLSRLGRKTDNPYAPINLLADFAGGSFVCAMGIIAALFERASSGKGQVIDASMVEGAAYVSSWLFKSQGMFIWGKGRGQNFLDGGAAFYDTFKTKDGKYMAVGAIEPQFYAELVNKLEVSDNDDFNQYGTDQDTLKSRMKDIFATKTRDEWAKIFNGSDACVTPILELEEAPFHPHNMERRSFVKNFEGKYSPSPAPKLSRTPARASLERPEPDIGENTLEILKELKINETAINNLLETGAVYQKEDKSKL